MVAWPSIVPADDAADTEAILARARGDALSVDRVIQRAKANSMLKPSSSISCSEYIAVRNIDKQAIEFITDESKSLQKKAAELERAGDAAGSKKALDQIAENDRLKTNIEAARAAIMKEEDAKDCEAIDAAAVIKRARENKLTVDRVLKRAETDELIKPKASISCKDYAALRSVDAKAVAQLSDEIKALRKEAKDLGKAGDSAGAQKATDAAGERDKLMSNIQRAQARFKSVELQKCQAI